MRKSRKELLTEESSDLSLAFEYLSGKRAIIRSHKRTEGMKGDRTFLGQAARRRSQGHGGGEAGFLDAPVRERGAEEPEEVE